MTIDIHHVKQMRIAKWTLGENKDIHVLVINVSDVNGERHDIHLFTESEPVGEYPRVIYDAKASDPIVVDATATVSHVQS